MFSRDPLANPEQLIRKVYAYVAYRIGDGPDAEDVTSETFERALRYRDSYDRSKGEPAAWVIGIARRCLARESSFESPCEQVPDTAGPSHLEEESVLRVDLRAALARLGQRDRELLALRYGGDLTAPQIGQLLDMGTNAVEVSLHRARERLAAALSGLDDGAPTKPRAKDVRNRPSGAVVEVKVEDRRPKGSV
jgi:RNA polymerase sigma-70 factor (ECF subfamily)